MPKHSAGLMMYRWREGELQVFLVHPGGPYWAKKDRGVWSIPKGEYEPGETPVEAARREFHEETGFIAGGPLIELGQVTQASGKVVTAWAFEGDCDPAELRSNRITVEWPPRSGRQMEIPEVDRGAWFSLAEARERVRQGQDLLIDRLPGAVGGREANADALRE